MKRPGVVWVFSGLGLISFLFTLYIILKYFVGPAVSMSTSVTIFNVISIMWLIPLAIMVYNIFMLNKKALLWTHVNYASSIVINLLYAIYINLMTKMGSSLNGFIFWQLLWGAFMWWVVADYIKKKNVDGNPLFT